MRETSVGLGVMQFLFTAVLICLLVWLALVVGIAALVLWMVFHLVVTLQPARTPHQETTNGPALLAAAFGVASCIPLLVGNLSWMGAGFAFASVMVCVYALLNATPKSTATRHAMKGTILLGVALSFVTVVNLWMNAPTTLYGQNWGDNQGTHSRIMDYKAERPCLDQSTTPAAEHQDLYTLKTSEFIETTSCIVSDAEDTRAVVFVQAASASDLDSLFASGILEAGGRDEGKLWVQRDGAVAVITSDEASEEIAQDTGTTWISLYDEKRKS